MLAVNIPAMFGLIVLAHPIAQLLFEHGRFLPSDTLATAAALQLYALGLIGYSTVRILSPVFYAVGRSAVPVIVSTASIALNLVLSLMLVRTMGFRGLALGTSIAALTNGALLLVLLRRQLAGIGGSHLSMTVMKSAAAAAVMAAVAFLIDRWLFAGMAGRGVGAGRLVLAILGGLTALAITARALRIREFDDGFSMVRQRVQKLLGR
jgi:putative peptidoglycan lipid II flippase